MDLIFHETADEFIGLRYAGIRFEHAIPNKAGLEIKYALFVGCCIANRSGAAEQIAGEHVARHGQFLSVERLMHGKRSAMIEFVRKVYIDTDEQITQACRYASEAEVADWRASVGVTHG